MGIAYNGKSYSSISEIAGPTGWYTVKVNGKNIPLYINQDYDGGGWVLVLANRRYTAGMNNLKYDDAIYSVNYRHGGSNNATNELGLAYSSCPLSEINCWVGLDYWQYLGGRKTANKITTVQFMAGTNGTELHGTHTERIRWQFNGFTSTGGFSGVSLVSLELDTNGWGNSGMYSYVANGRNLTTYDKDQDTYSSNCSTFYNNNPFWYGSCWSGNIFAGGSGYIDGPYWTSSSSTYSQQYCGVYIK